MAMKMSHKIENAKTAGPWWGVVFGVFMTFVGLGLWIYAQSSVAPAQQDESLAVGAMILGLFMTVYALREVNRAAR
jgi:hypothetical protein